MNFTSIGKITLLALIVFIFLAIFVKGYGPSSAILTLLSVSTFLFGVFGAFIMQDRYARLNSLRSVLRSDDAHYASIYKISDVFGKNVKRHMQKFIDDYLTKTIDYKLLDYNNANKEFLALYEFVVT